MKAQRRSPFVWECFDPPFRTSFFAHFPCELLFWTAVDIPHDISLVPARDLMSASCCVPSTPSTARSFSAVHRVAIQLATGCRPRISCNHMSSTISQCMQVPSSLCILLHEQRPTAQSPPAQPFGKFSFVVGQECRAARSVCGGGLINA